MSRLSEVFYAPKKALCDDGVTRTARVKCYRYDGSMAADTYFSVPAYVKARGRTVRGFVTGSEDAPNLKFHAYRYRKNHAVIVAAS